MTKLRLEGKDSPIPFENHESQCVSVDIANKEHQKDHREKKKFRLGPKQSNQTYQSYLGELLQTENMFMAVK